VEVAVDLEVGHRDRQHPFVNVVSVSVVGDRRAATLRCPMIRSITHGRIKQLLGLEAPLDHFDLAASSRTDSLLVGSVCESLGAEACRATSANLRKRVLHFDAGLSRFRRLRTDPHPVVDVRDGGNREIGIPRFIERIYQRQEVPPGFEIPVAGPVDSQEWFLQRAERFARVGVRLGSVQRCPVRVPARRTPSAAFSNATSTAS
jgi:hypothetical protein